MFKFANITHLDDVRHAISEDFYLAERPWGFVINYHINAFPEIKDDMSDEEKELEYFRREFRGIKFDVNGNLIARPFHKFFNWGEKEAEMAHFDFNQPFVIMDKLDGSMIHPMMVGGQIYWSTKMGAEDFNELVKLFVEKSDIDYNSFAREMINQGYTPLFEFVSPAKRIVVGYEKTDLILTAIRNNVTGEYVSFNFMNESVKMFGPNIIPVVKIWNGTFTGINDFMEAVGGEEQCEGYIIRFENGHMVKLKNAWYLNLHRAKSELDNERNVWRLVLNQQHDDLIAQLDDEARKALETFAEKVSGYVKLLSSRYHAGVTHAAKAWPARKDFAINFAQKTDHPSVVFKILDGKDAFDAVTEYLLAHSSNAAKMEGVKKDSGINWRDYYYPVDMDG